VPVRRSPRPAPGGSSYVVPSYCTVRTTCEASRGYRYCEDVGWANQFSDRAVAAIRADMTAPSNSARWASSLGTTLTAKAAFGWA
jgi:hypothetical protein